jgi:hypothetical protein
MKQRLARMLTRLYPPAWRDRYGEEFEAMLAMGSGDLGTMADSIWSALREHVIPARGGNMEQDRNSFGAMMRRPSAYLPVAMSLAALAMVLGAIAVGLARGGAIARDPDEGGIAHLFQLLMTVQWPIMLFFAVKWMRRAPRQTMGVLGLQAAAWLAGCAPVYFLHL